MTLTEYKEIIQWLLEEKELESRDRVIESEWGSAILNGIEYLKDKIEAINWNQYYRPKPIPTYWPYATSEAHLLAGRLIRRPAWYKHSFITISSFNGNHFDFGRGNGQYNTTELKELFEFYTESENPEDKIIGIKE